LANPPLMIAASMFVAVTDIGWFDYLRAFRGLDEVNFWRPGSTIRRPPRGTPYLFKLKAPRNVIGGVGFFDYGEQMTIAEAWEFYGDRNGAGSAENLRASIERNAHEEVSLARRIGCELLSTPFFFEPDEWISLPADWPKSGIQVGKNYDFASVAGQELWQSVLQLITPRHAATIRSFGGFGLPTLTIPRRGQGTFRRLVLNAYGNQCAVSGEHTVPVLQASHIRPFSDETTHEVPNGISLRSDIHTLFDRGFVTITPDHIFRVSKRLRDDYHNGRIYYDLDGIRIHVPKIPELQPKTENLEWHGDEIFKD
jgi:putative restriction endonuclease